MNSTLWVKPFKIDDRVYVLTDKGYVKGVIVGTWREYLDSGVKVDTDEGIIDAPRWTLKHRDD